MDFIAASKLLEKFADAPKKEEEPAEQPAMTAGDVVTMLIGLIISVYAAYLSWECNSAMNVGVVLKVVYALFAALFGMIYLIFYVIFRAGTCSGPAAPAAPAAPAPGVGGRARK
jgi:hypothetical protein